MMPSTSDQIRAAAGVALQKLIQSKGTDVLDWSDIHKGFELDGQTIHFASQALGIFKPTQLQDGAALSIRQVLPSRAGRTARYDDREIAGGIVVYKLQGDGKANRHNRLLEQACVRRLPVIFFRGVADSRYETLYPVFLEHLSYENGEVFIVFDQPKQTVEQHSNIVSEPLQAEYGIGSRKTRLHQQAFRKLVLGAYGLRCALTNLPLIDLLQAAHIIRDADGGEASVRNGIAMSTFHHAAYEANLLGIDPDGRIHLSERITEVRDGPMYDHGMLRLEGMRMRFPLYAEHKPNPEFLAMKFDEFRNR